MTAFLRATARERRSTLEVLRNIAEAAGCQRALAAAQELLAGPAPVLRSALADRLLSLFQAGGRGINQATLLACCLLVDLERGHLSAADLARGEVEISPAAAMAVAEVLGCPLDEPRWQAVMGPGYAHLRREVETADMMALLKRVWTGHIRRTTLDILGDLGREAGSARVTGFVERLRPLLPSGQVRPNDEQLSLLPLLGAAGWRINPAVLVAFCLFVDIEVGNLGDDDIPRLARSPEKVDTSLYAMMAAAGAFGLELDCFEQRTVVAEDSPEALPALVERCQGGLLACFRKPGEAGRWWEWLQTPEEARRRRDWGLEFTGILMARLKEGQPAPASLSRVPPDRLVRWSEALSRQSWALRRLYYSLQRVLTRQPETVLLRSQARVFARACEFLGSGKAASLLGGLVSAPTREGLLNLVRQDPTLDFRVCRPLLQLAEADPELLGLRLLLELCSNDSIRLRGTFKQWDEAGLRQLAHERTAALLGSDRPDLRQAALSCLVCQEEMQDRSARLRLEYPLSLAVEDADPEVALAALDGLVRLTLSDLAPLPRLVEACQVELGAAPPQAGRLAAEEGRRGVLEVRAWLGEIAERDPDRLILLPLAGPQGEILEDRVAAVGQLLAAANQASREDGSLRLTRYYLLASVDELAAGSQAFFESWNMLAREAGCPLHRLLARERKALLLEHRLLVEDRQTQLLSRCNSLPFLGGRGRPRTYHVYRPGERLGASRQVEVLPHRYVAQDAPFFLELLEMLRRIPLERVRLVRLVRREGDGLEALDTPLSTLASEVPVELHRLEVLQADLVAFAPFLKALPRVRHDAGLGPARREEWEALLAFYEERPLPAAPAEAGPEARPPQIDQAYLEEAASRLAARFQLPEEQRPLVKDVLVLALHQAGRL